MSGMGNFQLVDYYLEPRGHEHATSGEHPDRPDSDEPDELTDCP